MSYDYDEKKTYVFVLEVKGCVARIFTTYDKAVAFMEAYCSGGTMPEIIENPDKHRHYMYADLRLNGKHYGMISRKELE